MRVRHFLMLALGASLALGAAAPALADDDWGRHERHEWREHAWRQHEWREQAWREQAWREQAWREHEWRENGWRARHWHEHDDAPSPVYYGDR